jgi:threonine/homoserine/homoserine lactone efflux protein
MTPGPDMALVTRNALRSGAAGVSWTAAGVAGGSLIWGVASVLGLAVLLEQSAVSFTVLKLAGAAYLIILGIRSLNNRQEPGDRSAPETPARRPRGRGLFIQGLFGNLLNPKAGVIFITVIPQFVRSGDSPVRLFLMLGVYELVLVGWLCLYGRLITRTTQLRAGRRIRRALNRTTGVVLIALGARVALERGR